MMSTNCDPDGGLKQQLLYHSHQAVLAFSSSFSSSFYWTDWLLQVGYRPGACDVR